MFNLNLANKYKYVQYKSKRKMIDKPAKCEKSELNTHIIWVIKLQLYIQHPKKFPSQSDKHWNFYY